MTISTYLLAVAQLGLFLRAADFPLDPTFVGREHLVEWMRYLQRSKEDGGQGVTAQTALQRYRSVSRLFALLVDAGDMDESPMARVKPPRVTSCQSASAQVRLWAMNSVMGQEVRLRCVVERSSAF